MPWFDQVEIFETLASEILYLVEGGVTPKLYYCIFLQCIPSLASDLPVILFCSDKNLVGNNFPNLIGDFSLMFEIDKAFQLP